MIYKNKKNIPILLFTFIFVGLILFIVKKYEADDAWSDVNFILADSDDNVIHFWKDESDNKVYAFLPSYVDLYELKLQSNQFSSVFFDEVEISDGDTIPRSISINKDYNLLINNHKYTFCIVQSENVSTMYIDTKSDSMKKVHSNKSTKEDIILNFVDEEGNVLIKSSGFNGKIRGHGNSTWNYDKKPYNLYFNDAENLCGNCLSKEWVLLANVIDQSNLRNYLMYELANETSENWNPHCRFTDLYLNGDYCGLYLIVDKVSVGDTRLELTSDDILLNFEVTHRASNYSVDNLFPEMSDEFPSISAEICYPSSMDAGRLDNISNSVTGIFEKVYSHSISDDELTRIIDVDSWAWLYLLQEISLNNDSGQCSLYFILRDGKLFAGPAWDYDNTFGVNKIYVPECLYAKNKVATPLWRELLKYEVFEQTVLKLYKEVFYGKIEQIFGDEFSAYEVAYYAAGKMNEIRWKDGLDRKRYNMNYSDVEQLNSFFEQRFSFLNKVWLDEEEYCDITVRLDNGSYRYFSIQKGNSIADAGILSDVVLEGEWFISENDTNYDINQKVDSDIHIYKAPVENSSTGFSNKKALLIFLLFCLAGGIMACVDYRRYKG